MNLGPKQTAFALILGSTYLIGQLYCFFPDDVTNKVNWFIGIYKPLTVSWNVKLLAEEVNRIIEAIWFAKCFHLVLKYAKSKGLNYIFEQFVVIRLSLFEYFLYRCLDLLAYFWDFKTERYWFVFLALGTLMGIVWYKKIRNKEVLF